MFKRDELPESENDKQIVYKINGDFKGDIKGKNVTVIVMGVGNIIGNIDCKNGEIVLINGDIKGNVKADKIIHPEKIKPRICEQCKYYSDGEKRDFCLYGGIVHYTQKEQPACGNFRLKIL